MLALLARSQVSAYDAATTFFPAWRRSIKGGAARGVMCSYNEVNGVPSCASDFLLRNVLRGEEKAGGFGFDGCKKSPPSLPVSPYLKPPEADPFSRVIHPSFVRSLTRSNARLPDRCDF